MASIVNLSFFCAGCVRIGLQYVHSDALFLPNEWMDR